MSGPNSLSYCHSYVTAIQLWNKVILSILPPKYIPCLSSLHLTSATISECLFSLSLSLAANFWLVSPLILVSFFSVLKLLIFQKYKLAVLIPLLCATFYYGSKIISAALIVFPWAGILFLTLLWSSLALSIVWLWDVSRSNMWHFWRNFYTFKL